MSRVARQRIDKDLQRPEWPTGAVIGGVDTHKHVHVAAACDPLRRVLGTAEFPNTTTGFKRCCGSCVAMGRWLPSGSKAPAAGAAGWPVPPRV